MKTVAGGRPSRECGLCRGRAYDVWWTLEGFEVGRCVSCGLVQVTQEVSDAELDALYTRGYYEGETDRVYQNYLADPAAKERHFGEQLDRLTRECDLRPGALLEIGAAFGLFLSAARARGWTVRGTERSVFAAEWARRELGIDVDSAPDALSRVPSASQDFVVLWDVIEHLRYPLDTVQEAHRVLRPGGRLALTTGDVGSLGARLYGRRWWLMTPPHHLFYFDHRSMTRLLERAGFRTDRIHNGGGHPLECGRTGPRLLRWIAKHDRYIGWRFNSGPIIEVVATA